MHKRVSKSKRQPDPADVAVGARIRLLRNSSGLSQEWLAHKCGVTFQQIQKYEKGRNRVSPSRMSEIAAALGVPVALLYGDEGERDGSISLLRLAEVPDDLRELGAAYLRLKHPRQKRGIARLLREIASTFNDAPPPLSSPEGRSEAQQAGAERASHLAP